MTWGGRVEGSVRRVGCCLRRGEEAHFVFFLSGRYPSIEPPPLDKRNPKPLPKKLSVKIKPVEVCDMTKYVFLG